MLNACQSQFLCAGPWSFYFCHEIGHILSQHHRAGTTPSLATEAEADRIAANPHISPKE
jgi:hypothetical protein